jgi:signal transduction histidine kinase
MVADAGLDDPRDASRLYQALERVSSCLAQASEEGRAALTALRSSATQRNDLAEALARAGQDCVLRNSMTFALTVKGTAREMHPIVRDEVYRIGYEAMRNACSHSRGTELNVELTYAWDLTVVVRDNGRGFDEERVAKGKDGHFGVRGMRERAERIGAKLHFDSTRSGTHVELIVPGKLTFRDGPVEKRSWFKELLHFFRLDR